MFTYPELAQYAEILNAVKEHTLRVQDGTDGIHPDSSQSFDLNSALAHAQLLAANANALVNEIRSLRNEYELRVSAPAPVQYDGSRVDSLWV